MVGEEGLEPSEPKHLGYNQARYQLRSTPSYIIVVRVERIELSSRVPKARSFPLTDTHIRLSPWKSGIQPEPY